LSVIQDPAAIRGPSKLFLRRLKGVTDPSATPKSSGHVHRGVSGATKRVGQAKFLAQGTLYPDVIESVPIAAIPPR